MPSHLTRQVFRRLLANEPLVYRECLRRQGYSTAAHRPSTRRTQVGQHGRLPITHRYQRRTFFNMGMFKRTQKDEQDANLEPGIDLMMEFAKRKRMNARLPFPEHVAEAWMDLYDAKDKQQPKKALEDTQAKLVLQSLRYILECQDSRGQEAEKLLPTSALLKATKVARLKPRQPSKAHLQLAKTLHEALINYGVSDSVEILRPHIDTLCWLGRSIDARDLLQQFLAANSPKDYRTRVEPVAQDDAGGNGKKPVDTAELQHAWTEILKAFVRADNETGALQTISYLQEINTPDNVGISGAMLDLYLQRDDMDSIKHWWDKIVGNKQDSFKRINKSRHLVKNILLWCLSHNQVPFGQEVVHECMKDNPPKLVWDAIFVWAAGTKKSVDEIGRMFDVMEKSNRSIKDRANMRLPDINTINTLVEYAISQKDPYMAERFIALGRDRNIQPDARTYTLQMDYRLDVGDVDGALVAYKHLQGMDLSSNEDIPTVNRLIVGLCTSKRHDFDTIMNVAADLSDRRASFEPLTVSSLAILHLSRDELHDVADLLNTHVHSFSSAERESVRQAFIDFCRAPATEVSQAWDTYTVLCSIFDEMPRVQRTEIMLNFFKQNRPDMAVHTFNHMRHHTRADTIPTVDTYVSAFLGSARLRDLESLEVIHNQLKLDYNVTQTTYLRNALIIAYSACEEPRRGLDFWDEIVATREGPTYNSIHVALRACEKAAFGDMKAQEIWARLRRNDVELDQSMWASYIAALAGNGDNELALTTLEEAEQKGEVDADVFLLGSLFTASPGQVKQEEIESWAKHKFPMVWAEVEKAGFMVDENGMRTVKIDRTVTP